MMTAEQLRSSILQLAMQGKLVEQRPEEGTGKSIYLKLKQEQKELIASGRIKEKNLIGEIEAEEIEYDLPDTWTWARIEECGYFISGYTPKNSQLCNKGTIPYFKVSDMNTPGNEIFLSVTEQYLLPDIKHPRVFEAGTIVYPKNGGAVFTNKKRILTKSSIVDLNTGGYKPSNNLDPEYVFILYSMIDFRQCCKGTALPTIDMEKLRKKLFPIPPLAEQKRIVAKIEELIPFVEQYDATSAKLDSLNTTFPDMMKKSILQEAVQGKLVPQDPNDEPASELLKRIKEEKQRLIKDGKIKKQKALPEIKEDEIPFEIPDSWKWVRLDSVTRTITDGDHQAPPKTSRGIPFLVISNISSGNIDFSNTRFVPEKYYTNLSEERKPEMGDLMFTVTGSYGIPVKVDTTQKFCFQRHIALIKPLIDIDFLMLILMSPLIKKQCDDTATGTAQKTVGLSSLRNFIIPVPPRAEQIRILEKVRELKIEMDAITCSE